MAAVHFDETGSVLDSFHEVINPNMPVPSDAAGVHGLDTRCVRDKPTSFSVLNRFVGWLPAESVLVAHNAPFDLGVLHREFERAGVKMPINAVIDSLAMARRVAPGGSHDLTSMLHRFGLRMEGDAHRAMPDANALRRLLLAMMPQAQAEPTSWSPSFHYSADLPDQLTELPTLVEEGASLSFTYTDGRGQTFLKTITPFGWAVKRGALQLHGLCHYSQDRRTFLAERMIIDQ
jgi:DNA polymerase III epsilon subunit family exonuclease